MIPILTKPVITNNTNPYWVQRYSANHTISGSSTTLSALGIGTAQSERQLIVLIGGDALTVSTMTWEAGAMDVRQVNGWGRRAILSFSLVTSGTSGDLVINWDGDHTGRTASIVVITAYNVGTAIQVNGAASAASSGSITTSVSTGSVGQKGLVFGSLTSEFQLNTSWTLPSGITEQLDRNIGSRRHSWAVYESNGGTQSVRAYQNNTWNDKALIAGSFRKN